ncbi:MAG: PatB family C-S lyase [Pseudomonadota bacterium]
MTAFEFDESIDRREVPALKVHPVVLGEGGEDLFPAGVADMDFKVAPVIRAALQARLEHEVFGYEAVPDGMIPALQNWLRHRHRWEVAAGHILRAPNALNSLAIAATLFSGPGEGIIVQPPVFFDFYDIIQENGRTLVRNPLTLKDGRYEIDFEHLETVARRPGNRLLFLCNPHNPVGRAWRADELKRLGEICLRHDVLVVADELHGDIVYPGHTYVPFASVDARFAENSVTITSPAKTFNIASCCCAFTIVPDAARRAVFQAENSRLTVNKNNAFANAAMEAAYREGGPWLDAVTDYLHENLRAVREQIADIPEVRLIEPEATFLLWLDFSGLGLPPAELHAFLRQEAGIAMTRGSSFGDEGAGFMRLNIACPRAKLLSALDRLAGAIGNRSRPAGR